MFNILALASRNIRNKSQNVQYTSSGKLKFITNHDTLKNNSILHKNTIVTKLNPLPITFYLEKYSDRLNVLE